MIKKLVFTLLILFLAGHAVGLELSAEVNRKNLTLSETVQFSVNIEGDFSKKPVLPALSDFYVIDTRVSNQISMTNFKTIKVIQYVYVLKPKKEGELVIGSVNLEEGGKKYSTLPIKIMVKKGISKIVPAAGPSPLVKSVTADEGKKKKAEDNIFVEEYFVEKTAYVEEQVVFVSRFYYDARLFDLRVLRPVPLPSPGFIPVSFGNERKFQERINGRIFNVVEYRTAYFPIKEGEHSISGPDYEFVVVVKRGFLGSVKQGSVKGKKHSLDVSDLPVSEMPADFKNQVGKYSIDAAISKKRLTEGEPLTFKFTITGNGNLGSLTAPISDIDGFKIAGIETETKTVGSGKKLKRKKIFSYIIIPLSLGNLNIPPAKFSYFDPETFKYEVLVTSAIEVYVEKGEERGPVQIVTIDNGESFLRGKQVVKEKMDLPAYRKDVCQPGRRRCNDANIPLTIFIYMLGLGIFIFAFMYSGHLEKLRTDEKYVRRLNSGKMTKKLLLSAADYARNEDAKAFSTALKTGVREFIGSRLNVPSPSVDAALIKNRITSKADEDIIEKVKTIFNECDMITFSSKKITKEEMLKLLDEAGEVINGISKVL